MSNLEEKRTSFFQEVKKLHESQNLERLKSDLFSQDFVREQQDILEACKRREIPAPDVLDVERSACSLCPASCTAYEPFEVFLLETQERAFDSQFVPTLCRNCKCPAFFHQPIKRPLRFVAALLNGVKRFQLKQEHLNFPGEVAIFSIDFEYLEAHREEISFKTEEDDLFQLLHHGGFQIISRTVRAVSEQESVLLTGPKEIKPVNAFKSFIKTRIQAKVNLSSVSLKINPSYGDELLKQSLIICLSSTSYQNAQEQFGKFMEAASSLMPKSLTLLYCSKTTLQALGDMEVFFPHVFEIKHCCALIAPELPVQASSGEEDTIMEFFKTQHSRIRGEEIGTDKNPNLMNLGKVFDTLIFNGYNVWRESALDIQDEGKFLKLLDKVFDEKKALGFLKFILSNKEEGKLAAVSASRVGVTLYLTNNPFSVDTFLFTNPKAIFYLYKFFFPELATMQRTLVVFRPVTVRSGLHTLFLDIFKINHFLVLKSKFKMLTQIEALSLVPGLDEGAIPGYLDCMLEGESMLVVLGKFGAVHEAQTLCDGSKYGRKRTEKSLIGSKSLFLRREKEIKNPYRVKTDTEVGVEDSGQTDFYSEEVVLEPNKGVNSIFTLSPFTSLSELLDLETLVNSWMDELEHERDKPNLYARHKARQDLRQFSRQFNFAVQCSISEADAEKEIASFFPGVQLVSEALLVSKDAALNMEAGDLPLLFEHMQLRVVRRGAVSLESASGDCYHVVKPGCKEELRAATFFTDHPFPPLMPQHIGELFHLIDSEPELQQGLTQLCSHVAAFTAEFVLKLSDSPRRDILSYITLATLAKAIKPLKPDNIDPPYQCLISTLDESHAHYVVTTEEDKEVEVAIRRLASQEGRSHVEDRLDLFNEYEGITWYFREVRKHFPKIVPAFFQYRIEPSHPDMPVERVFTCAEFMGEFFLNIAAQDMMKDRAREQSARRLVTDLSRGSIATFMWGRNLSMLCQKLQTIQTLEIEDCGPIFWNGKNMLGSMDDLHFFELEQKKYLGCLESLRKGWTNYIPVEKALDLEEKLRFILSSAAFKQSRDLSSVSLVPEFISYTDIRVRSTTQDEVLPEELKSAKFMRVDLERQARMEIAGVSLARTVHALAITNVQPAKYSKRHLAANIYWILSVYLRKLDRKLEVVKGNSDEYEALVESLCDGFMKTYPTEEHIEGISLFRMEFFLFSIWQCWKIVLALVSLDEERTQLLTKRDESLRNIRGAFKEVVESFAADLEVVRLETEKLDFELTHQLEQLTQVQLQAKLDPAEASKFISIKNDRYFKHYGLDYFEPNIRNPKYPDILKREKFPGLPEDMARSINPNLSQIERMWMNPERHDAINLRQVPEDAYKYNATKVKATRWVTEERQKTLVTNFVKNLMATSINKPNITLK